MKIWTRAELYLENNPQDLLAPSILSAKKEDEASSDFQGCAPDDWIRLLGNRFLVILLNISGFLGRVEGMEWKMRRPSLAM